MFRKKVIIFLLSAFAILCLNNCDRTGSRLPNSLPVIEITSYGGDTLYVDSLDVTIFQQDIFWNAYDADGWVEAFAFRILDEDENPIKTPGFMSTDSEGWILHYLSGVDQSVPIDTLGSNSTIWTDLVHAEINFPAYGDQVYDPITGYPVIDPESNNFVFEPITSIFEIKCVDDRGDESEIYRRYYKSETKMPNMTSILSTQGAIDKKCIGTGVIFEFMIGDDDPLIGNEPSHFIFKLQKVDLNGEIIPEEQGGYKDKWYSTKGQSNVSQFKLIPESVSPLGAEGPFTQVNAPDPANEGTFLDSTYLTAIAYDLAGIPSQPLTIHFAIKEGFYPSSLIYNGYEPNSDNNMNYNFNDIYALGDHHYSVRKPDYLSSITIAEEITPEGTHYALPLWIGRDTIFAAVNSPDLKIYMHWGHEGEYGTLGSTNDAPPDISNSPFNQRLGLVRDERTQELYYSELTYYDLQMDGEPYHYPPIPATGENLKVDDDGQRWLRIPIGSDIDQRTILYDLEDGEHVFRVRAVDLSEKGDPTPAEMRFKLISPIASADKEGILIVDDDHMLSATQEAEIDSFYLDSLSDFNNIIEVYDFEDHSLSNQDIVTYNSSLHFDEDVISPVDMLEYKLVIYHSDQFGGSSNFYRNFNSLNIFFELGGNILTSFGDNAVGVYKSFELRSYTTLSEYFGITHAEEDSLILEISNNPITYPFLIGADPAGSFSTPLNMEMESENGWPPIMVTNNKGIGPCCYFKTVIESEPIYTYRCKPDTATVSPPTAEEYLKYNGKNIAVKFENGLNINYMFGFSLPYMQVEDVRQMFNEIFEDLGM